jgi:hypothetical protein
MGANLLKFNTQDGWFPGNQFLEQSIIQYLSRDFENTGQSGTKAIKRRQSIPTLRESNLPLYLIDQVQVLVCLATGP